VCWGSGWEATASPLGPLATLTYRADDLGPLTSTTRVQFTAWVPPISGLWAPSVHANCEHNVVAGLRHRVLGSYPPPDDPALGSMLPAFGRVKALAAGYCGERWSLERTAQSYSGSLGRRYAEALKSLRTDGPVRPADCFLRAFLKAEKFQPERKFMKPRMIFPRSPRYNLHLASWLKPFEHWLWQNLRGVAQRGVPKSRVVAKGLDGGGRAELIARKFNGIRDCVVFEVDAASFEAHHLRRHRELEHSVYARAFRGDPELQSALAVQLRMVGACGGVRFERDGGMSSGDFNTGMGNSILMVACVETVARSAGLRVFDSLTDGDNSLLFVPRGELSRAIHAFRHTASPLTGQELTLEAPVSVLEEIVFGQSHPVWNGRKWLMVRDYRKVMSCATSSHKHLRDLSFVPRYLLGVALCENSLNEGLPVLDAWSVALHRGASALTRRAASAVALEGYRAQGLSSLPRRTPQLTDPCPEARDSFCRAFGLTPDEQRTLEGLVLRTPFHLTEWNPEDGVTQATSEFSDLSYFGDVRE
jgi:hypothetical protein